MGGRLTIDPHILPQMACPKAIVDAFSDDSFSCDLNSCPRAHAVFALQVAGKCHTVTLYLVLAFQVESLIILDDRDWLAEWIKKRRNRC